MNIESEHKLDYADVLLRPKRSRLGSRKEVSLERTFKFQNYEPEAMSMEVIRPETPSYSGIPIMASNMDGVGTMKMADALADRKMFTCLVKTYSQEELISYFDPVGDVDKRRENVAISIGISLENLRKFRHIYKVASRGIKYVCIDVANGYSERFVAFVKEFREEFPNVVIIAGNVVTREMTEELILAGADIIKVGIGPGCFLPGTIVNTIDGPKPIEDVKVGDMVKTHTGAEKPVTDVLVYDNTKPIISINGIKSTDTHEYYVLHKRYKDIATDENVHELAEWLEAKDLTKEYLLLKHK